MESECLLTGTMKFSPVIHIAESEKRERNGTGKKYEKCNKPFNGLVDEL